MRRSRQEEELSGAAAVMNACAFCGPQLERIALEGGWLRSRWGALMFLARNWGHVRAHVRGARAL